MLISNQHLNILRTLNILYIEDEENIKQNVKKTLLLFSDNIFDTENIEGAKKILLEKRIDIVLSDINLPDKSGIDFIKELRKIDKKIPIIILSAYTHKDFLLEATKLKLIDYLTKPIDFKSLHQALNKCVDEILDNSRFIITFKNHMSYNVLQKKLIDTITNEESSLTLKELTLLEYLIENNNRIISTEELKRILWEDEFEATDSALKNLLNKLRKKMGKDSIINISGVGYRLDY